MTCNAEKFFEEKIFARQNNTSVCYPSLSLQITLIKKQAKHF